MVCVPCILLPILLAIYIRFIQPIVFRLLPESWRTTFDAILYPTCPTGVPLSSSTQNEGSLAHDQSAQIVDRGICDDDDSKKAD